MYIRKSVLVALLVLCSLTFGIIGVTAAGGVEKITAHLNHDIKFKLDGITWTPKGSDNKNLSPVMYNGSTYLPARALSEALDAKIDWNGTTKTITIARNGGGNAQKVAPLKDEANSTPSASGVLILKSNFDIKTETTNLKADAVAVIKSYGESLKSGDTSKFNEYVNNRVGEKGAYEYVIGRDYTKERISSLVKETIDINDSDILLDYASALINVQERNLKTDADSSYKNEYTASISYTFSPEDFDVWSSITVSFKFTTLDDGRYVLDSISIL